MEEKPVQSIPAARPLAVIPYHGPTPLKIVREVTYERDGRMLIVTVPPAPFVVQIIIRSAAFLVLTALFLFLFAMLTEEVWRSYRWTGTLENNLSAVMCPGGFLVLLALGIIGSIRSLVRTARRGRECSTIRAWPGGIEVIVPGAVRPIVHRLSRDRIAHLQIHPSGYGPRPKLVLEIIAMDDSLYLASLPWPRNTPMIELEDNLRDVLGLSPDNSNRFK